MVNLRILTLPFSTVGANTLDHKHNHGSVDFTETPVGDSRSGSEPLKHISNPIV